MRLAVTLTFLAAVTLPACQDLPQAVTPTATAVPGRAEASPAVVGAPTIEKLVLPSKAFIGAESIDVYFNVKSPGSGSLKQYGMATRLGGRTYPIKDAIPVIAGGRVEMRGLGPLPNVVEAGKMTLEFWVIDSAGKESNKLTGEILIQ